MDIILPEELHKKREFTPEQWAKMEEFVKILEKEQAEIQARRKREKSQE